ncbi:MAG: glycosyltransferase family 2 protein [Acidobacteria bacterium]|nr:glycosyltransferase family 2 protein [Acidobacteriota bacterium]
MTTPYGSIVIPTHDRDTTLALAVRSAPSQSVRDVEVIIAGDGCTPAVRAVALELAREDRRVRFLDLPKAPLRGGANRDVAVRSAAASRIFYNDDDDLLLPHHVELLGEALNDADVVDTPVVSVCTEGRVAIGLHDSGHPVQRRLLVEERFKGVFDTHLAHWKRTYTDRAGAWLEAPDHRAVLHMLKSFAASSEVRWTTLDCRIE